jgi:hypothetical protein
MVSHTKGRTQIEGVSEKDVEEKFKPKRERRVIKSRMMRWTGNVAYMGYEKCIQNFSLKA